MPEKHYKRREFLKGLGLLGAGALAGSLASKIAEAYTIPQVERVVSPRHPDFSADVIVYRDGDYAVAVDRKGNTIARSTDHAEVIQKAIDHVAEHGGGVIFIKAGTYMLTRDSPAQIYMKSHVTLIGAGKYATKLVVNRANGAGKGDGINLNNTVGCRIKHLWVDCKTYDQRAAIAGSNVNDCIIEDCRLENKDEVFAVYFAGPTGADDSYVDSETLDKGNKLINCEIYGEYPGDVLSWSFQMDSEIRGCKIWGRVALYKGKNVDFHDNIIYGSPNEGIWVTGKYYNVKIHNNIIRDTPSQAIRVSDNVYGLEIRGNILYRTGPEDEQTIYITEYAEGKIEGNYIYQSKGGAIGLGCDGKLVVRNNIMRECNRANRYWYNGGAIIGLPGRRELFLLLEGNVVYDLNENGAPLVIWCGNEYPKAEVIFRGNIFNRTNPFVGANHPDLGNRSSSELYVIAKDYLAKYRMENNYGFTDTEPEKVLLKTGYRNSGVAIITANSTKVTVSHELIKAPSKVLITPLGQPPGKLWVENITDTSFDIVTDTAPSEDLKIAWYAEV